MNNHILSYTGMYATIGSGSAQMDRKQTAPTHLFPTVTQEMNINSVVLQLNVPYVKKKKKNHDIQP